MSSIDNDGPEVASWAEGARKILVETPGSYREKRAKAEQWLLTQRDIPPYLYSIILAEAESQAL